MRVLVAYLLCFRSPIAASHATTSVPSSYPLRNLPSSPKVLHLVSTLSPSTPAPPLLHNPHPHLMRPVVDIKPRRHTPGPRHIIHQREGRRPQHFPRGLMVIGIPRSEREPVVAPLKGALRDGSVAFERHVSDYVAVRFGNHVV